MKTQIIQFVYDSEYAEHFFDTPKPASKFVPEWYKKSKKLQSEETIEALDPVNVLATNTTIKACAPFFDALTAGYVWSLPSDIEIRKNPDGVFIRWRDEFTHVTSHSSDQIQLLPVPAQGNDPFVFKWVFNFYIKTPKNHSTLFTHPINRHDLPFRTFTGVVDTDKYPVDVQFPFQVLSDTFDEVIIIKKGTPVVQFIPFLRENWKHKALKFNPLNTNKRVFNFVSNIQKAYKNNFWVKKSYK